MKIEASLKCIYDMLKKRRKNVEICIQKVLQTYFECSFGQI